MEHLSCFSGEDGRIFQRSRNAFKPEDKDRKKNKKINSNIGTPYTRFNDRQNPE